MSMSARPNLKKTEGPSESCCQEVNNVEGMHMPQQSILQVLVIHAKPNWHWHKVKLLQQEVAVILLKSRQ